MRAQPSALDGESGRGESVAQAQGSSLADRRALATGRGGGPTSIKFVYFGSLVEMILWTSYSVACFSASSMGT